MFCCFSAVRNKQPLGTGFSPRCNITKEGAPPSRCEFTVRLAVWISLWRGAPGGQQGWQQLKLRTRHVSLLRLVVEATRYSSALRRGVGWTGLKTSAKSRSRERHSPMRGGDTRVSGHYEVRVVRKVWWMSVPPCSGPSSDPGAVAVCPGALDRRTAFQDWSHSSATESSA